ncbi:hypothetical protein DL769_003307 [Monosporascus sp. CRB-8-3]|nr:hypothetical protein DL769_003307 [Monosporascus sp. CRB-8-3]
MISGVGYLHENPHTESLLLRKGLRPLNEREFLQVIDLALSGDPEPGSTATGLEKSCIITGLEPASGQGYLNASSIMQDPRMGIILSKEAAQTGVRGRVMLGQAEQLRRLATTRMKDVPAYAAEALVSETDAPSIHDAVLRLTCKRLSSLILIANDQMDPQKPLAEFGIDSMIGAEFRSWI